MRISASSIKTLNTCNFLFYYSYLLRGETFLSPKTVLGSCVHEVFEALSNKRHRHLVEELLNQSNPNVFTITPLYKLVTKILKRNKLTDKMWLKDANMLIVNGLREDFYQDKAISHFKAEHEFWIKEKDLEVRGFIDRAAIYPPTEKYPLGYVVCRDFKSQKELFTKDELDFNIQALIYQWALYRETGLPIFIEFVMLRHGIRQIVPWSSEDKIKGTISYLEYVSKYVNAFDIQKAKQNLAADDPNKEWLCGKWAKAKDQLKKDGQPYFSCWARWPRTMYSVFKEDGDIKYTTDDPSSIKSDEWDNVKSFKFGGCPAFNHESYK